MLIQANGVDLFYERTGQGEPFILLHGNSEDHTIFDKFAKMLARHYTVYAVDSRCHGKSSMAQSIGYDVMTEDIVAFIQELCPEKPVLMGFSDGGIIGLLVASRYPDILSRLIACGANTHPREIKGWVTAIMKLGYRITRDSKLKMMLTEPDITREELGKITVPTMIVAGSRDIVYERYTKQLAASIPRCALRILPGETHGSYILKRSERLYKVIAPFLKRRKSLKK